MPDQFVKTGSTAKLGRVDGDLTVGRNATIRGESGDKVVVTGRALLEGTVTIDCDFESRSMRAEGKGFGPGGDVSVNGSLTVRETADVDASARVSGEVQAKDLDIGGHFRSGKITTARLRVGGHLEVRGTLDAAEVDVGGHMTVTDEVKIHNLLVGGHTKVGGGSIDGDIRVRGHFTTSRKLVFGRFEAYGNLVLPAGSEGERLTALGRVEFDGDSSCKELEVTGTTKVRGTLTAENINLKGTLASSGDLQVSKRIQVWGTADVGRAIECETLGVGGKLVADRASATKRIDIAGELRTVQGLKSVTVTVGKGSKVSGPIYAEKVDVGSLADLGSVWGLPWWRGALGRLTTVEDVHGQEVILRSNTRAGHIFGKSVEMEDGAMAEEITFTDQIKLPGRYFLTKPPTKVENLPSDPL